jgi:ABC-type transporter Mla MlaB component
VSAEDSRPLELPARVDAGNAVEVLARLQEAAGADGMGPLALDLAPLQEFDSSALSLLLQLARSRTIAGATTAAKPALFLLNPPEKLQELAELYGVGQMLFGAAAKRSEGTAAG